MHQEKSLTGEFFKKLISDKNYSYMQLKASAVVVLKIFWVVAWHQFLVYDQRFGITTHHTSPFFLIGSSIQFYPLDPTPI
jgi:hypothetical protein